MSMYTEIVFSRCNCSSCHIPALQRDLNVSYGGKRQAQIKIICELSSFYFQITVLLSHYILTHRHIFLHSVSGTQPDIIISNVHSE